MSLKRGRVPNTKTPGRHLAQDTTDDTTVSTTDSSIEERTDSTTEERTDERPARRLGRRRLIPGITVAAFALGYIGTSVIGGHNLIGPNASAADEPVSAARPSASASASSPASASPAPAPVGTGAVDPAVKPYVAPKMLAAVPVGPGKVSKPVRTVLTSNKVITALDAGGVPVVAVKAYQRAAADNASCHLPWQVLAAIGRVESDNGLFGGAQLRADGTGTRPILGIPLDGRHGVELVRDTDNGKLDGDRHFDRAVGPMQFLPSSWAQYKADGNGDGKKDPSNIFDAARAAADYLCDGGADLSKPADEAAALRRYNNADEYVQVVFRLAATYRHADASAATPPKESGKTTAKSSGHTADVGWAPAMRQVVVNLLNH